MSTLADWYKDIWDYIVNKIGGLTDFDAANVFYGEKFPVENFPSAYVSPVPIVSEPATFRETFWNPSFEILVVQENPDTKLGLINVLQLCWKIVEAFEGDRQLGGLVQNLELPQIIPYPRGMGRGTEQHWASVIIICQRKQ